MANKTLFKSLIGKLMPATDALISAELERHRQVIEKAQIKID